MIIILIEVNRNTQKGTLLIIIINE